MIGNIDKYLKEAEEERKREAQEYKDYYGEKLYNWIQEQAKKSAE
jgi:hypothetical protein